MKIELNISPKYLAIFAVLICIAGIGIVFAEPTGKFVANFAGSPNPSPGHTLDQLAVPAACANGDVLTLSAAGWTCAAATGGTGGAVGIIYKANGNDLIGDLIGAGVPWSDMKDMTITEDFQKGNILINFQASLKLEGGGSLAELKIYVDGVEKTYNIVGEQFLNPSWAYQTVNISHIEYLDFAGVHTIKVMWRGQGIKQEGNIYPRTLTVVALSSTGSGSGTGGTGTFVGATLNSYDGARGGYAAADNICKTGVAGSNRVCTAADFANSLPPAGAEGWYNGFLPSYWGALTNDCAGWSTTNVPYMGSWWSNSPQGQLCSASRKFLCCASGSGNVGSVASTGMYGSCKAHITGGPGLPAGPVYTCSAAKLPATCVSGLPAINGDICSCPAGYDMVITGIYGTTTDADTYYTCYKQ